MKFTIFTPFYEYIECAEHIYESLLKQTYIHWEWLILDDFSENPEVLSKLKYLESLDDRVKLIYPEYKNQFLFNLPVKHSSGDIMVVIDSDDIPYPKLLEVYKNIYEKFPNLSLLGCTSIIKRDVFSGETTGAKYINYNASQNYMDAKKNGVMFIMGDARSFRMSKLPKDGIFSDKIYENIIGVDIQKVLIMEELGDILAIPRNLHNYTMRDGSMSGSISANKYRDENEEFVMKLFKDANERVDRNSIRSINSYFDEVFNHSKNFYFSDIDSIDGTNKIIEYWNNKITIREKVKLNELYFDHKIYYNVKLKNPNTIIISVENENDLDLINVIDDRKLTNCSVTITTNSDNYENLKSVLASKDIVYWYNFHHYLTIKFNI